MFAASERQLSPRPWSPTARRANTAETHGACDTLSERGNTGSFFDSAPGLQVVHDSYDTTYIQSLKAENQALKDEISRQSHRVTSLRELFHEFHGNDSSPVDEDTSFEQQQQEEVVEVGGSSSSSSRRSRGSSSCEDKQDHSGSQLSHGSQARYHRGGAHNTSDTSAGLHCDRKRLLEFERQSRQDRLAVDRLTEHMRDFKLELMPTIHRSLEHAILGRGPPDSLPSPRIEDAENTAWVADALSRNIDALGREWRIVKALMTARTESNELIRRRIMASNLDLHHRLNQLHRSLHRSESDSAEKENLNNEESRHLYAEIRRLQEQLQRELEEYESHIRALQEDLQMRDQTIGDARRQIQQMRDQLKQDARERADMQERAQGEVTARLRLEQEIKKEQRRIKELQLQLDMLKMGQLEGPLSRKQQNGDVSRVVKAMNQLVRENEKLKKLLAEQGVYIRRLRTSAALAGLSEDTANGSRNDATTSSLTDTRHLNGNWLQTQPAATADERSGRAHDPVVPSILLDKEVEMVAEGRLSEAVLMARLIEGGAVSSTARRGSTK